MDAGIVDWGLTSQLAPKIFLSNKPMDDHWLFTEYTQSGNFFFDI